MTKTQNLLLHLRNVQVQERFAESTPFQCELWGGLEGVEPRMIAAVSNAGTGGGNSYCWPNRAPYEQFLSAVAYAKKRPLDQGMILDWLLLAFHSWLAKQIHLTLPEPYPLADELELVDSIVDRLLTIHSLDFGHSIYFGLADPYDIKVVRIPDVPAPPLQTIRKQILWDFPGATILNDLTPAHLPLPIE